MSKIVLPLIVALGTFACAHGGVPAPDFTTPFDAATPEQIRSYLAKLRFDDREGPSDEQALPVGCPAACRPGPDVAIQPEKRIHRNSESSLAIGPGRIIARFINKDPTESYPDLNLGPKDTVYWAVDQVKPSSKENVSEGRSLYISARGLRGESKRVVVPGSLHVRHHPNWDPWKQALARWIPADSTYYDDHDETPGGGSGVTTRIRALMSWGGCRSQSCCGP